MIYRIGKTIRWEASHRLEGLSEGHPCGRMHGHSYEAEIVLTSESLDDTGFVLDYGVLGAIRNKLDHQHLNDIMPGNPTAERLAVFIATLVNDALFKMGYDTEGVRVESVLVKETASSWAMVSF